MIKPLGYDWKIGIALITSFAAREVFIGTMATLYSVEGGKDANRRPCRERMASARTDDGAKVYTPRNRRITDDILCLRYAVHEYPGRCETRNPRMEMAHHSTRLYDGACIRDEFYCISTTEIGVKR